MFGFSPPLYLMSYSYRVKRAEQSFISKLILKNIFCFLIYALIEKPEGGRPFDSLLRRPLTETKSFRMFPREKIKINVNFLQFFLTTFTVNIFFENCAFNEWFLRYSRHHFFVGFPAHFLWILTYHYKSLLLPSERPPALLKVTHCIFYWIVSDIWIEYV